MHNQRAKIEDPKVILKKYVGRPLQGIYHIENNSIVLFPSLTPKARLTENEKGVFVSGYWIKPSESKAVKYENDKELTAQELAECNQLGYAPRFVNLPQKNPLTDEGFLSAHEYVVRLMGTSDLPTFSKLRGFTVTQSDEKSEPTYDWKSGSMNTPRDPVTLKCKRQYGSQVEPEHQKTVRAIIGTWLSLAKEQQLTAQSQRQASQAPTHLLPNTKT